MASPPLLLLRSALVGTLLSLGASTAGEAKSVPSELPVPPELARANLFEARPLQLVVRRGRATLSTGPRLELLTRLNGAQEITTAGSLECGPGSSLELSWTGQGSVRIQGPARLSWRAHPTTPGEPLLVSQGARSLQVEMRRGNLEVELGDGWALRVSRAAVAVETRADGSLLVQHHAGQDVPILTRKPHGRVPDRIRAGERIRLGAR